MTTLATHFRTILSGLQVVIGIVAANDRARDAFLARIYYHLNRTMVRFEKLVAHWRAGTLPKTGKPRPGRPARPQTTPRLPNSRSWLLRSVDHYNFRGHASQLQHFLASPECAAFLAEVPRAGRILRPLARSLALQMPGDPPPPMPKPAPKPKPAKNPWLNLPQPTTAVTVERRDPYPPCFSKAR